MSGLHIDFEQNIDFFWGMFALFVGNVLGCLGPEGELWAPSQGDRSRRRCVILMLCCSWDALVFAQPHECALACAGFCLNFLCLVEFVYLRFKKKTLVNLNFMTSIQILPARNL